ncbi:hypothetical protein DID88_002736 [Monilinia fructigena]|uniref:Symplekin/Pta1 N-terminal domain-containing protein n=1 Tax=Monilinia fructigena TaxID=38457 RepID=A0A395IQ03_9HELO|nr:hypothetical protein DID88_002736 [Monilinia fructigena]
MRLNIYFGSAWGSSSGVPVYGTSESFPLPPRNLEAEASGLLDRLLGVFQENSSDAVLVDATLNSLSILIRARPHIANKILNVLLNFNPLKLANSPMTPKLRVMVKLWKRLLDHYLSISASGREARLQALSEPKPEEINAETAPLSVEEDDDDYEPDLTMPRTPSKF